ncbi:PLASMODESMATA CALLOSE-BINDING PROTEIN 3 [Lactuca sativa]|uniref:PLASMODESMATA CALLOSE-BINDING PROTEIN 3 n=1 Tax=Lactuca sativa TaxID=4236 RepID=UPI000CCA7EF3|nr:PLASMODESMATA CALLOSE-BINDING PROTEIN 3 [Lactuca sativa]
MGTPSKVAALMAVLLVLSGRLATATWCVARSDATQEALQTALDYACSAGADCAPLQQSGLCFLPNTIQAHASYAFNSYYMRKSMAPGSCDFSGTATIAKTDPSYGSCVYPPTPSSAGGTTPITTPSSGIASPPPFGGGLTPDNGMVPTLTTPPNSKAFSTSDVSRILHLNTIFIVFLFIF